MERLSPVRSQLLEHTAKAANLLDIAGKTFAAERKKIVSPDEARELCVGVLSDASRELMRAVELIASRIPPEADQ